MDRKPYQEAALDTLARFARQAGDQGPHLAFGAVAPQEPAYRDQGFGATHYVCLRLPTGGGKTVLAADAIPVLRRFAGQDFWRASPSPARVPRRRPCASTPPPPPRPSSGCASACRPINASRCATPTARRRPCVAPPSAASP